MKKGEGGAEKKENNKENTKIGKKRKEQKLKERFETRKIYFVDTVNRGASGQRW